MSFHPPTPRRLAARRAEHGEIVHFRIPPHVGIGPLASEHELEIVHDLLALLHALRAERRAQQLLRGLPLHRGHLLQRKPLSLPRTRDVMPVETVRVFECERGFCTLVGCQRLEKLRSGGRRVGSRAALTLHCRPADQESEAQQKECGFDDVECVFHGHILPAKTSAM